MLAAAACAAALWLAGPARAAGGDAPIPAAQGYVTDAAGIVGDARRAQLESFLDQLQKKSGVQFAVLTVKSTAPEEPDAYKVRAFQAWGIGQKGKDEGLLMLVALDQHRVVFETGYGLEGTLTDVWEAGMLRDLVVPRFRAGQYADGVTIAVLESAKRIAADKGITLEWTGDELRYDSGPQRHRGGIPPIVLAFVIFSIVSGLSRLFGGGRRGFYGGGPWLGGGWGGGFGGGGGGSSFGGFGGGGSGGGGGGASW